MPMPPTFWDFDPTAWPDDSDCVAGGADLEPSTLIGAYRVGAFPMPDDGQVLWWSPLLRGVLRPGDLRISRSLAKSVRRYTTTVDTCFDAVIAACADPSRAGAWIDDDIRAAYEFLHELGWAHSVEVWDGQTLVGGLYGLAVGGLFAGESMFHRATDASKVALVELVRRWSGPDDDWLIDTQWSTPHLASLGVSEIARDDYRSVIADLVDQVHRDVWTTT